MSATVALEGQLFYFWISHLMPDKLWKKELNKAYRENRVIKADFDREVDRENGYKLLFYKYRVAGVEYEMQMLSDSFPSHQVSIMYEKDHPEIATPIYHNSEWKRKYLPKWWMYLIAFLMMLAIATGIIYIADPWAG